MIFKNNLHFVVDKQRSDGYSSFTVLKSQKYNSFMHQLTSDSIYNPQKMNGFITSRVKKRLFGLSLYFMVLDCDSMENRRLAISELENRNITHYTAMSSPGHFWVFCDYIGTMSKIISMMETIPGIDREYISHCAGEKAIHLRAYPKDSAIPLLNYEFIPFDSSNKFQRFIWNLSSYWNSADMKYILSNLESNERISVDATLDPEPNLTPEPEPESDPEPKEIDIKKVDVSNSLKWIEV